MMTKAISLALLCGLMVVLPGSPLADGADLTRVRIGYPSPSASFSPLFVAKEAGLFEKHGLSVELLYLQGVQITQVHVARQVDFTVTGAPLPLQASVEGADLILIGSSIDSFIYKLIVVPSITRPEDLRGKTIGITRFGSLPDVAIRQVLKKWGMNADRDVKLLQIGRMTDMVVALSGKRIDAGVISDPTSFQAEKMGMRRLLDMADIGIEFSNVALIVSREYSRAHRDLVLRFLKAYIEGTRRFLTDKQIGIKALRKYTGMQDQEILAQTYDLFAAKYIKKVPKISLKGVENTIAMIAERNPKAKNRRPEEFVDLSLMEELENTGFVKSVWP
ncbi:MAG: ABC transporter substrate-binding protein [Deltaproteobacteria bacterium]|nr:ABC transporter substrate-binding protein [Deltaproteobacteria bacterium]